MKRNRNHVGGLVFASFFFFGHVQAATLDDAECLALNMYFEARDQGTAGMLAVSHVVLNRVRHERFPDTICEVIKQGPVRESWKKNGVYHPIRNRCQLSWWCDGKSDVPRNKKLYKRLLSIAEIIISGGHPIDISDGALFYHAHWVTPAWSGTKHRTTRIGDHIFYRIAK